MNAFTKILAAASLAAFSVTAVQAQDETRSVAVSMKGIDLSTAAGQKTLANRIALAAKRLCDGQATYLDSGLRNEEKVCRANATSQAMASVTAKSPTAVAAR